MKKYLTIIKIYWQRAITYRFVSLAYRIGEVGEMIILIVMWTAIYSGQQTIGSFTLQEMITYILFGSLFQSFTRNFLDGLVANDIKEGRLSTFLIRPLSYFQFIMFREIGRISIITTMSITSQLLVILIFRNKFIFALNPSTLLLLIIMMVCAFFTELLLSYLIGLIAFWTDEVDGIYTTIWRMKKLFSGGYFPLNLLPLSFIHASYFLPFAYSFFVPSQLYLNKINAIAAIKGIGIQIIWIILLSIIINFVWKKGLKKYEGVGI